MCKEALIGGDNLHLKKVVVMTLLGILGTMITVQATEDIPLDNTQDIASDSDAELEEKDNLIILNNKYNNIDYNIDYNDDSFDVLYSEHSSNLDGLSKEESWLISNNVIERPYSVKDGVCLLNSYSAFEKCPKTLLYCTLYRAYDGPIESRYLFIHDDDYKLLVTSNVYELYLKELLDKGFISKDDFNSDNGKLFIDEYNLLLEKPSKDAQIVWDTKLGSSTDLNSFGHSATVSTDIAINKPNYFNSESMLTMDAINIIADYVRYSEKDMSELEAGIVAYKYGIHYLDKVDENTKSSIEFLIAKGILDYENPSEFINLYGEFTYEDFCNILYRVANKDARLDFSKITLTDSETFWQSEGYYKNSMKIKTSTVLPEVLTIDDEYWQQIISSGVTGDSDNQQNNSTPNNSNFIDDLLGLWKMKYAFADDLPTFTVTKLFNRNYDYTYKGILIQELSSATDKPEEFVSYEEAAVNNRSSGATTLAKVTFNVTARDYETAVLYVDNNIAINGGLNVIDVDAYTTIDDNGDEITLIPATVLQNSNSDISIIEDKVLINNVTGVQAVILPDNGYALVGNRIVVSDTLMMTDTSDEVYYNLEIISTLLSNTYLSNLASRELFVCNSIVSEQIVNVKGSTGNVIGQTYVTDISYNTNVNNSSTTVTNKFYNIDNLNNGNNVITRKFIVNSSNGQDDRYVYVIVRWDYVVPDVDVLQAFIDNDFLDGSNVTMNDVNDTLFTRPVDPVLQEWWDSNISVSNSLANFMYGTAGVEYIKSGYLAPSIYVLRDSSISDATVSSIFTSNGFKLNEVGLKYCGSTTNWWETYFSASAMSDIGMKSLATASRHYAIINSESCSDGKLFNEQFFVTKAGIIYENVESNQNITFSNNEISLITRDLNGSANITGNTMFTYGGNEWVYVDTVTFHNIPYYRVVPNFAILENDSNSNKVFERITIKSTSFGYLPVTSENRSSSSSEIKADAVDVLTGYYNRYFPSSALQQQELRSMYRDSSYMYTSNNFLIRSFYDSIYDRGTWYLHGDSLVNRNDEHVSIPANVAIDQFSSKKINCIPCFYLPINQFHFAQNEGSYYLVDSTMAQALCMSNVFKSGLSQNVIDSIVYRNTKTVPINSMISKQRLLVGDIMFTRTTDSHGNIIFVSDPIYNAGLAATLKYSDSSADTNIIKNALFAGQLVNYGGYDYYLSNFITEAGVGTISNAEDGRGILYSQNGNKYVYLNGDSKTNSVDTCNPTGVCIYVKFSDGLFARPTTEKQNTYVLLYVSSVMGNRTIDNIPFFNENLSFGDASSDYVNVENSKFTPSSLFSRTKRNFKVMMHKAFAGDVITIIWMFIFYFATYLAIMTWIAYFVLTKGYARNVFEMITIPSSNNGYLRKGFDLIKIFTFGIYNIDSEPTLARTFVASFICFFVSYAIVFWRPF